MRPAGIQALSASDAGFNHFQELKVQVNCRREPREDGEDGVSGNLKCLYNTYMSPAVELDGLIRSCNHRASLS